MGLRTKMKLLYGRFRYTPKEALNDALDKTGSVVKTVIDVRNYICDLSNENTPRLSDDAYARFEIYLGKDKAEEVKADVESGRMEEKEAEEWSKKIELVYENSRGRRSIEPEEWQDFEEGWRPENW